MHRIKGLCVLALWLGAVGLRGETAAEALVRAEAAVEAAAPHAHADPMRPIFHVTSPAQWINDPNGPIFHKGFYHIFYQLTPYSDQSGVKYWGHARSRDLVHWETLPIAIAPSGDLGEESIWSGCCTINGRGDPMIFYTSIGQGKSAFTEAVQWAAVGDEDLVHWTKSPANPVMTEALHGGTKIYDWRDPFIFEFGKRTFMVLGGSLNESKGGQAVVNIYEAQNPELTEWSYRGVLFQPPDEGARTAECPNFFKLGSEWVLLVSPYGKVQYFLGDFDPESCRFHSRSRGLLDRGPDFYAPNTMQMPGGRRIVWGWVKGFPGGRGWNGCLSLPRLLSILPDGQLRQQPAPQLRKLRGELVEWRDVQLKQGSETLTLPPTNTVEIQMEIDLQSAANFELRFQSRATDVKSIVLNVRKDELRLDNVVAPLEFSNDDRRLTLNIFFDRSVMEVFANETVCITKVITPLDGNSVMVLRADGENAKAERIQVWPMNTIW